MPENEDKGGLLQGVGRLFLVSANLPILALLILFVLGGAIGVYTVRQRPALFGLSPSQQEIQKEVEDLISKVGKLIALPEDENPTVATVTDVEAVKDQTFFAKAQNGDKVLIYTNARKAILYRPSENRILEVGLVNINQQDQNGEEVADESAEEEAEETPTPTPEEEEEETTPTPEEETPTEEEEE